MVYPSPYGDNCTVDALHAIQPGFTTSKKQKTLDGRTFYELQSDEEPDAPYLAANPLEGLPTHHYTQLLFKQPALFNIPDNFKYALPIHEGDYTNRINFDLPGFVNAAGLGKPVAGNYFSLNRKSESNSSDSSSTVTASQTSSFPSSMTSSSNGTLNLSIKPFLTVVVALFTAMQLSSV